MEDYDEEKTDVSDDDSMEDYDEESKDVSDDDSMEGDYDEESKDLSDDDLMEDDDEESKDVSDEHSMEEYIEESRDSSAGSSEFDWDKAVEDQTLLNPFKPLRQSTPDPCPKSTDMKDVLFTANLKRM